MTKRKQSKKLKMRNITSNICAMTSICSTIGAIGCLMIEKPLAFMILFFGAMITLTIAILTEQK